MSNFDKDVQIASIKLFHSVLNVVGDKTVPLSYLTKYGIIPTNKSGLLKTINKELADLIIDTIGIKNTEWIQSFHKSWDKIATAPIEQLIAEQILNYFSTYGLESLDLESLNYVPVEKILIDLDNAPSLESFVIVRIINIEELKSEIKNFIQNVKSPNRDSIEYIRNLIFLIKDIDVESIKSFEIKTIYCDIHHKVPSDCQDFLRFAIYKASQGTITTIVKDKKTIELLKSFATTNIAEEMFENADLMKLSESFYRFKPLFLAFKSNKKLANKINKIRRYAITNHKPVSGFVVSNIMNLLAFDRNADVIKIIEKADIKDLVKLINFTKYELESFDKKERVYNIRNGKIFVRLEEEGVKQNLVRISNLDWLLYFCKERLKKLLNNVYSGLTFYIPESIDYVVPVSEKQMMDVLPNGTRIVLPEDAKAICIAGHWFNQERRIDLDFHLNSFECSFGWNSNYRSFDNDILFSGDMTDAPKPLGAVEAYRISSKVTSPYFLTVNVYNTEGEIPFELLFTKDISSENEFKKNSSNMISAVINPANAVSPKLNLKIHKKEESIGFYNKKSFIICGGEIGGRHRVPKKELMKDFLNASINKYNTMMSVKDFIELAGGTVIKTKPENVTNYIDFSINNITATTFFDVVNLKKENFKVIN